MNAGSSILLPLPAASLASPQAFGGYLSDLSAAGGDTSPAVDVLEGGLLAVGEEGSELAQFADWYRQTAGRDARRRFSELIAGRVAHPDNDSAARRALGFWRNYLPRRDDLPFPSAARFLSSSESVAAAVFPAFAVGLSSPAALEKPAAHRRLAPSAPAASAGPAAAASLREKFRSVLTAGIDQSSEALLQFKTYRELPPGEKIFLHRLWDIYNAYVRANWENPLWWRLHPEYDRDPLAIAKDVVRRRGLDNFPKLLDLHHAIRTALADGERKILEVRLGSCAHRIPYRIFHTAVVLDSNEALVIRMQDIQEVLKRFENAFGRLPEMELQWYQEALIRCETVARYRRQKGMREFSKRSELLRGLFPDKREDKRQTLSLLLGLLTLIQKDVPGDSIFEPLQEQPRIWDLAAAAAKALGTSVYFLAEEMGLCRQKRLQEGPNRLADLDKVLQIFNLLSVQRPWEILVKLYPDVLRWAFSVRRSSSGLLLFKVPNLPDLAYLSRSGLGPLLNNARFARRLEWRPFAKAIEKRSNLSVNYATLSLYGANNHVPGFWKLKALAETLAASRAREAVYFPDFFLAAYPTFIGLLPLYSGETRSLLSMPMPPPYRMAHKPERRRSRISLPSSGHPLDTRGLPDWIRRRRLAMNCNLRQGAAKLGLTHSPLMSMERDPDPAVPNLPVPERTTLAPFTDPKGYGLPVEELLRRHQYTYWKEDPVIIKLVRRTLRSPVVIGRRDYRKLERWVRFPFRTPAEMLFYWRSSQTILANTPFRFPPGAESMAEFLGISPRTYEKWEKGTMVPRGERVNAIVDRLGVPRGERSRFLKACRKMRAWIREGVDGYPPHSKQNNGGRPAGRKRS